MMVANATGKGGNRAEERHRGHGRAGDQVRGLGVFRHARSHGVVAVLPIARRKVLPPRTPEEEGEFKSGVLLWPLLLPQIQRHSAPKLSLFLC